MHPSALTTLSVNIPTILACVVGLAILPFYWRKARPQALLVLVALLTKVLLFGVGLYISNWMFTEVDAGAAPSEVGRVSGLWNGRLAWLHGATWGLLIYAALMLRPVAASSTTTASKSSRRERPA